jgi:hypothetical protein
MDSRNSFDISVDLGSLPSLINSLKESVLELERRMSSVDDGMRMYRSECRIYI